jgi:hypothetical protein
MGYKQSCAIWEAIILYRKLFILFNLVFLSSVSVHIQAAVALLTMIISYNLQYRYKPFMTKDLNEVEELSIIASTVTIYCGLYYLSDVLNYEGKVFFFIIIVSANFYFLFTWFTNFVKVAISENA